LTLTLSTDSSEEDTDPTDANINSYNLFPQSTQARLDGLHLLKVFNWLQDLIRPDNLSDLEYVTFMQYSLLMKINFGARTLMESINSLSLWTVDLTSFVLPMILSDIHIAFYATKSQRFWWPSMVSDIHWYTKT
jgi:hypothetical protein